MPVRLGVDQLPRFLVSGVAPHAGGLVVSGTYTRSPVIELEVEVGDEICLWRRPVTLVGGITRSDARGDGSLHLAIELGAFDAEYWPTAGEVLPAYGRYHDRTLSLVLDRTRPWKATRFAAAPAFVERDESGRTWRRAEPGDESRTDGTVVPRMWDHEHCEFCWKHIEEGGESADAFVDDQNNWVCPECYRAYVEPCDLSFVLPNVAPDDGT